MYSAHTAAFVTPSSCSKSPSLQMHSVGSLRIETLNLRAAICIHMALRMTQMFCFQSPEQLLLIFPLTNKCPVAQPEPENTLLEVTVPDTDPGRINKNEFHCT